MRNVVARNDLQVHGKLPDAPSRGRALIEAQDRRPRAYRNVDVSERIEIERQLVAFRARIELELALPPTLYVDRAAVDAVDEHGIEATRHVLDLDAQILVAVGLGAHPTRAGRRGDRAAVEKRHPILEDRAAHRRRRRGRGERDHRDGARCRWRKRWRAVPTPSSSAAAWSGTWRWHVSSARSFTASRRSWSRSPSTRRSST